MLRCSTDMLLWAKTMGAYNRGHRQTHVIRSTDGFLSIDDDNHNEFQQRYCREHGTVAAKGLVLAEVPSNVFPMFVQVEHVHNDGLTKEGMLQICSVIAGVLARYYIGNEAGSSLFESVSYQISSADVNINGDSWTKRVFSLVFRNLFVDKAEALQMRHTIVQELDGQLGNLPCSTHQWSSAISENVYTEGVIMCGQGCCVTCTDCLHGTLTNDADIGVLEGMERKYVAHRKKTHKRAAGFDYSSLRNESKTEMRSPLFREMHFKLRVLRQGRTCATCQGEGARWEENQSPLPTVALCGRGNEDASTTQHLTDSGGLEMVRMTSIRAPETTQKNSGYHRPVDTPTCPSRSTADNLRASGILNIKRHGMTAALFDEAASSDMYEMDLSSLLALKGNKKERSNKETVQRIQSFIRNCMGKVGDDKPYKNVLVKAVYAEASITKQHVNRAMMAMHRSAASQSGNMYEAPNIFRLQRLWVRVQGRGSCYCRNIEGHHRCNTVYFEIGPDKCWQRCFCTDGTVGVTSTTCAANNKNMRGGHALTKRLAALFSTAARGADMPQVTIPVRTQASAQRKHTRCGKRAVTTSVWEDVVNSRPAKIAAPAILG
ncbi:unnamed protein product [Ectocarpus sp. 6 AP-2014]